MASNSFKVKNSLVLTPKDLATLVSPEAGDLACDINDSNKIKRYDVNSASWVEVGSGGGVGGTDIFFVQDFESASLASFTQTGLTLSQTDPLHGKVSALLTHQAGVSPTNDQKFKQVIPVDRKFRGESMTLRLNCKSSASAGNVTINIYDETNSANIVASEQLQLANDVSGAISQVGFTIPATCASISYTITALPQSGSPVTRIDDVIAELAVISLLETSVEVPVVTAWQGYTPTFQGFGTPTNVEFEWRQVGENAEIRGKFIGGTPTAVEARVGLPAGLTSAGTSLIPSLQHIGDMIANTQSSAYFRSSVLIEPSVQYVIFGNQTSTSNALTKVNASVFGTATTLCFFASVPCAGLSATSTKTIALTQSGLVQEADFVLTATGNAGQTIAASANVPFTNPLITGSAASFNGTSITILESGLFDISATIYFTIAQVRAVELAVDNSLLTIIGDYYNGPIHSGSYKGYFTAGQVLNIRNNNAGGTLLNSSVHRLSVTKEGSLKQVSVSPDQKITIPTSELRFEGASSRGTSPSNAIVKFDTLAKLRGDAFTVNNDPVLGTSIVMKKAGRLQISTSLNGAIQISISKNQSNLTAVTVLASEALAVAYIAAGGSVTTASSFCDVNIGDVIRVSASAAPTAASNNSLNFSFQEQDISVSVTNTLPQFSESDSSVRVDTANGYGSTATKITRFSNVRDNVGVDVEYVDSATNGASFTAKSSGIYSVEYSSNGVSATSIGISKNASSLITNISSLAISEVLAIGVASDTAGRTDSVSWTGYLAQGDIVRAHTDGVAVNTNALVTFTMSKVGKPNVTGVNVTPFVNVPQPLTQSAYLVAGATSASANIIGVTSQTSGSGIFSYNSTTGIFTALKKCIVDLSVSSQGGAGGAQTLLYKNSTFVTAHNSTTSVFSDGSFQLEFNAGETFFAYCNGGVVSQSFIKVSASALSDQILTAPETFSTDTAALTYANAATYTLSTLSNAPVGTYITFTYAANTNTRTQTTLTNRPSQTDADMNANGMLIYTRAYNAPSTAGNPAAFAIQIGKGHKGVSKNLYKSAAKVTAGSLDDVVTSTAASRGIRGILYNESTGILLIDAAVQYNTTNTTADFLFSDVSNQTSGYLVINASKNPALTGIGLNRVAARGVNTAGSSCANAAFTPLVLNAAKTFDTHGALNAATGVFTAPETGYYQVSAACGTSGAFSATGAWSIFIYKNGVIIASGTRVTVSSAATIDAISTGSDVIFLRKGDTVQANILNSSGATKTLLTSDFYNFFSIVKVSV